MRPQRGESPSGSTDSTGNGTQQNQASLRRLAGGNQSQESFGDGSSLPPRSRGGMNGLPSASGRFQDRSGTPTSQRAMTPESSFQGQKDTSNDIPGVPPVPSSVSPIPRITERRRPPIANLGDPNQRDPNSDNLVPAPLSSPAMRRDDIRPPTRSSERSQPREREQSPDRSSEKMRTNPASDSNGFTAAKDSRPSLDSIGRNEPLQDTPTATSPLSPSTSPAVQMPAEPEEDNRPGLGSMIKKKKSTAEIARGNILKAAAVANAFKFQPRAGGAAEKKLREAEAALKAPAGADGITGVFSPPSLARGMSSDDIVVPKSTSTPTEKIPQQESSAQKPNDTIPEVKITVPSSERPSSIERPTVQINSSQESANTSTVKRTKLPPRITMAKEIENLGIDPNILGDRGGDLVEAWDQFGFVGKGIRNISVDKMLDDANRELNKIRTGGWLKLLEDEDERIAAIQDGLDNCIAECDELDGLLTLYSVELGVSGPLFFR